MGRCRSFDYKPLMSMSIPESEAAQDIELMNRIQQVQKDYLPIYIVGNICLAAWSAAWFRAQYNICQILCTITILAQLYSLFFIFRSRRNRDFSQRDYLTNIIIKPRMAGAILLMFKTWGAVDNQSPPSMVLQIYFGVSYALVFGIWARSYSRYMRCLRSHCSDIRQLPEYGVALDVFVACSSCRYCNPV